MFSALIYFVSVLKMQVSSKEGIALIFMFKTLMELWLLRFALLLTASRPTQENKVFMGFEDMLLTEHSINNNKKYNNACLGCSFGLNFSRTSAFHNMSKSPAVLEI